MEEAAGGLRGRSSARTCAAQPNSARRVCACKEANPRFFEQYLLRVRLKEQMQAFASLMEPSDGNPLQTTGSRDEAP